MPVQSGPGISVRLGSQSAGNPALPGLLCRTLSRQSGITAWLLSSRLSSLPNASCNNLNDVVMQKKFTESGRRRIVFVCLMMALKVLPGAGQVAVEATVSNPAPAAGDYTDITISLPAEVDFYYAEMEIAHDPGTLEFAGLAPGDLAGGGIHVAGDLEPGKTGVSVSRTAPLGSDASGSIMILTYRVLEDAEGGDTEIAFSGLNILDSNAETLPSALPGPVVLAVKTSISRLQLLIPAENTMEEGGLFHADAMVYAGGVTDNLRITCQAGVSLLSTHPGTWPEEAWIDMDFTGNGEAGSLIYSAEIAHMRPAGEWFVAVRSSLDGGDYVFGGPEGLLTAPGSAPAGLTIVPRPPFRYSLAAWDFDNESLLPRLAAAANREAEVRISGAVFDGFSAGYAGMALNSRNWTSSGGGLCYWLVEFSTKGFGRLEVSSRQYGSGTGPRDFQLEYSLDGFQWNAVEGGEITVATNWSSGRLDGVPLPEMAEDRDRVLLRWINISEISINGAITGTTGTSRIDDIVITGINPDPQQITVYPGDTNNDGIVNADDVLALGFYWLSSGPPSPWEDFEFRARSIEEWIPPGATRADTNGDGIVDHRDLLAIGLHFGKTAGPVKKDTTEPLASIVIDPLEGGHVRQIMVESVPVSLLRGIAAGFELQGIPPDMWEIGNVVPLFAEGAPGNELLPFTWTGDNMFEAAFALKGSGADLATRQMVGFELIINEQWNDEFIVNLNRLTASCGASPGTVISEAELVFAEALSAGTAAGEAGSGFRLDAHPNPFGGTSTISFHLEAPSFVALEIACIRGRTVAAPFAGYLEKGSHDIIFDGSFLPAGVYLCMLTGRDGRRQVIRMIKQ